ncbi:MAG: hypothetical protein H7061_13385 [Bdellovibrionaceae bacterium]|nr:hypothetical protein [Bdellovibrio sp.]
MMKKTFFQLFAACLVFVGCRSTPVATHTSELPYTSSRLRIMDLDEMSALMESKVREFKRTDNPQSLKDGLFIAFGRPDEDSALEKILSTIRTPLEDHELWEPSVEEMVDKSLASIKDDSIPAGEQVTYGVILENVISEFKPTFVKQYKSLGFETRIIEKIAAAEVEYSRAAVTERKLNMMKGILSPSLIAQRLIDRRASVLKSVKK